MQNNATGLLPYMAGREAYFQYFDGFIEEAYIQYRDTRQSSGLEKTYMLETVSSDQEQVTIQEIFRRSGYTLTRIENEQQLFRIADPENPGYFLGLLEMLHSRYPVIYTLLPANKSDPLIHKLVDSNPYLDRLWLSASVFSELWDLVELTTPPHRYSRLTFEHEALYELWDEDAILPQHLRTQLSERRNSRFTLVDRVAVIKQKLEPLRTTYTPLFSITHLRFPAAGRGGHDLYFDGKVTNRSSSFANHRETVQLVADMYGRLTTSAEDALWLGVQPRGGQSGFGFTGSTVTIRFGQELDQATFSRWIISIFGKKRNRFRLSGYPNWISQSRVHVNAIDHHLWQPLQLEFTTKGILGILPHGTCANTINRLITNVQRFVDPAVEAWIGETPYRELVAASLRNAS
ncbi:hypothetical protein GBF35_01850 [Nonomuraea phyllanthi]|uniref:hypothetical protein n=1 Tax=Nonomuraea phyllanthi TaxID=2219224 RepID=UPI001293F278|nr:hypothetical protein [Nonomuraea phyllanthi]QFY05590.1 hypothetical protein GBF35_01850 [Nonomuraea phyllanthi]